MRHPLEKALRVVGSCQIRPKSWTVAALAAFERVESNPHYRGLNAQFNYSTVNHIAKEYVNGKARVEFVCEQSGCRVPIIFKNNPCTHKQLVK